MKRDKSISKIILCILLFSCFIDQLQALEKKQELSWKSLLEGVYIYNVRNHHRIDYPVTINGTTLKKGEDYKLIIKDPGSTLFDYSGTTWMLILSERIYERYKFQSCQLELRLEKNPGLISLFSREKETRIIIPIIDECPELTKIIYQEFVDILHPQGLETVERNTNRYVNWETLLSALRSGNLKEQIEELPEAIPPEYIRKECYKNYWLLKFLKGVHSGESCGFEKSYYTLPESVKAFLEVIGDAFLEMHQSQLPNFEIKEIIINCTGYADFLHFSGNKVVRGSQIFYKKADCSFDSSQYSNSSFVQLGEEYRQDGLSKIAFIKDNCTLSAARAYTAMKYLSEYIRQRLRDQSMNRNLNIKYLYRAGGIIKKMPYERNNRNEIEGIPEDRKIEIEITINAADRRHF